MKDESKVLIITLIMAGIAGHFGVVSGDVFTGVVSAILGYITGRSHEKWRKD